VPAATPSVPPPVVPAATPSAPPPVVPAAPPAVAPPPATPAAVPPAAAQVAVTPTAPPATTPASPSAPVAPGAETAPQAPAPVAFQLASDSASAESTAQGAPSPAPGDQSTGSPESGDFWDGFDSEQEQASPGTAPDVSATPGQIHLETDPKVGGFGSGLFTEDDDEAAHLPAFGQADDGGTGEDRSWSYYDGEDGDGKDGDDKDGDDKDGDDKDGDEEDRGWSYDDPEKGDPTPDDDPPAFRSPAAGREELVSTSMSSRIAGVAGWRPSLPSFSLGGSALGMRARNAISILDSILEENGTEDIPKSMILGFAGVAGLLALVAVIAVLLT